MVNATSSTNDALPSPPMPRSRWLIALAPAAISCALYLMTLAPEVGAGDPAELALQAYQLGVTHPPGYPTHTFLGHVFGLAFDDPSTGTRVLSAVCMSVAVGACGLIVLRLTGQPFASLAAGLILALIPKAWSAAVVTEVYCVSLCFVALTIHVVLLWTENPRRFTLAAGGWLFGALLFRWP